MWGTQIRLRDSSSPLRFIPTHVGNTILSEHTLPYSTVHPHACGEHKEFSLYNAPKTGSSPRMWGTPKKQVRFRLRQRFIPTHVGNTRFKRINFASNTVHPHACGEHTCLPFAMEAVIGSSPRMWGTLEEYSSRCRFIRFIPTHVGNTLEDLCKRNRLSVHPHACGEHCSRSMYSAMVVGSSPRMWGTQLYNVNNRPIRRFIPTHVGNTSRQ